MSKTHSDAVFTAGFPVLAEKETSVVFGVPNGLNEITWGEDEGNRPMFNPRFEVDKKYWKLMGCPDMVVVAFSTEQTWNRLYEAAKIGGYDPQENLSDTEDENVSR